MKFEFFRSCPGCGARNHKRSCMVAPVKDEVDSTWVVRCSFCGYTGEFRDSREGAIEVWNLREERDSEKGEVS